MIKKIQFKRGLDKNLPTLSPAELAMTTDTRKTFIGSENGNLRLLDENDASDFATNQLVEGVRVQLAEKDNLINTSNWGLSLIQDNSAKINGQISKLDTSKTYILVFDEMYPVSSKISIKNKHLVLTGKGGLRALDDFSGTVLEIKNCPKFIMQNIKIDGATKAQKGIDIQDSPSFLFQNIDIKNIGNSDINQVSGVYISIGNDRFMLDNVNVQNIIASFVSTGINVDNFRDTNSGSKYFVIKNCHIENIQPADDADGIKVLNGEIDSYGVIKDCKLIDCAKRGLKIKTRYIQTENNYIKEFGYAGIDFQRGFCKSLNDRIHCDQTTPDNLIAISGKNNVIDGTDLIISTLDQSTTEGIFINSVSMEADPSNLEMKDASIRNVKIKGTRYPIKFSSNINLETLRIENVKFEEFNGNYISPSPMPLITTLFMNNIEVIKSGTVYAFFARNPFTNYYIHNIKMPAGVNVFNFDMERSNGFIKDSIHAGYSQENKVRYYITSVSPDTLSNGDSSKFYYAKKGDIAHNNNVSVLGDAGNQYIIEKWICVEDGNPTNKTKGTWVPVTIKI